MIFFNEIMCYSNSDIQLLGYDLEYYNKFQEYSNLNNNEMYYYMKDWMCLILPNEQISLMKIFDVVVLFNSQTLTHEISSKSNNLINQFNCEFNENSIKFCFNDFDKQLENLDTFVYYLYMLPYFHDVKFYNNQ